MTQPNQMQAFEAARRRHLVDATIETLADLGFKAASLSEIARRANVSAGLFAHYFGDKDGLLEATLRFMAARLAKETARRLAASKTRRERLYAVCDAALADEEFDRRTSAVWLAFWGQMAHSKRYQRVQAIYQRRMITNLRDGLRGMVPPDRVALEARMIAAMIDGLWLRSHVAIATPDEERGDGAAVRAVVHAFIDGLLAASNPAPQGMGTRAIGIAAPSCAGERPLRHLSPVTGEEMACFPPDRAAEIQAAVDEARRGLVSWRAMGGPERARILHRCAEFLRREGQELTRLETIETGRPIRQTAGLDLSKAIRALDEAGRRAEALGTTLTEAGAGQFVHARFEPLGIVAAAGHWSNPLRDLCDQAAALAHGNALIFVADPGATRTTSRLADLFRQAGLPDGVLRILRGGGESLHLLQAHPDVVTDEVDRRTGLDLGAGLGHGKAATIILPGADTARAAAAILSGQGPWLRSSFAGQNRVYVHATVRTALRDALCAAASTMLGGDPLDPATQVGPVHSDAHRSGLRTALQAALDEGAELAFGDLPPVAGESPITPRPLILDHCRDTMDLVRGHSFAPIVTLVPFEEDETLAAALRAPALAVGIFAGDPDRAWRLGLALDAAFCTLDPHAELDEVATETRTNWVASSPSHPSLSRVARIVGRGYPPRP